MARSNGGIIGKVNKTSFGKCTVTVHTSTGTKTLQPGTQIVDTTIVSGGGGGAYNGGGSGAGGMKTFPSVTVPKGSVAITIGGGGAGGTVCSPRSGCQGVSSTLTAIGQTYSTTGGGVGGCNAVDGNPGGSGGGAGGGQSCGPPSRAGGTAVCGEGNAGGEVNDPQG